MDVRIPLTLTDEEVLGRPRTCLHKDPTFVLIPSPILTSRLRGERDSKHIELGFEIPSPSFPRRSTFGRVDKTRRMGNPSRYSKLYLWDRNRVKTREQTVHTISFVRSTYETCRAYKHVVAISLIAAVVTLVFAVSSTAKGLSEPAYRSHKDSDGSTSTEGTVIIATRKQPPVPARVAVLYTTLNALQSGAPIATWVDTLVVVPDERDLSYNEGNLGDNIQIHRSPSVKSVIIQCRITWTSFRILLEATPNVNELKVEFSESCDTRAAASAVMLSPVTSFGHQIQSLTLDQGSEQCDLFEDVLLLRFPSLTQLIVEDTAFDTKDCNLLKNLMRSSSATLREVRITDCNLVDCNFNDIRLPKLLSMTVREADFKNPK